MLALGMSLARRGVLPVISLGIIALTAVGAIVFAFVLASRSEKAPLHDVPILTSGALAWGGGFLLAFSAALRALRRDRTEGVRALLVARTTSLRGYLVARVFGLALLLALLLGGGTLLAGIASALAASRAAVVAQTLQTTFASVVFSMAFSVVVAPIAFAALGARSRVGGYLFLLSVVVVPEIIVEALSNALPNGLAEVLSVPSALSALRSALGPGPVEVGRAFRAIVALAIFTALAMLLVRRDAIRVEEQEADA